MATIRSSIPHEDRTANEPRENALETVIISQMRDINSSIRLLRLNAIDARHTIKFSPGQWVDTFIPGLPKAGGFTITSTPAQARPSKDSRGFLELAIQKSTNPPAQWLWRPRNEILGAQIVVRVGGSFIWPPEDQHSVDRLVLIAGGVGINPLISIFAHLVHSPNRPREIHFLYASKCNNELDRQRILFLPRLMDLVAIANDPNVKLNLFLTDLDGYNGVVEHGQFPNSTVSRRINHDDLLQAINRRPAIQTAEHKGRKGTLCYVCGPPAMTDDFVDFLRAQDGMTDERVLCEKWW